LTETWVEEGNIKQRWTVLSPGPPVRPVTSQY
jgi:hypothetical protein